MRSHFHHQGWLGGLPVAQSWNVLVKPMVSLRACGARPSARLPSDGEKALRGQSGGRREGGFFGGTHSVRPRGKAIRKPRHNMIIGGKRTFGGLMRRSPGGSEVC